MLNDLIDSEKEDLDDLKTLRRRLTDSECLRLVSGLLERKVERIIELNSLLHYRDKDGAQASKPEVKVEPLYPYVKESTMLLALILVFTFFAGFSACVILSAVVVGAGSPSGADDQEWRP